MQKLLIISLSILCSIGLYAQKPVYSGSDDKLDYKVTVEKLADKTNDFFFEYYAVEVTNKSNKEVSFTPVIYFLNDNNTESNTINDDDYKVLTLAPGETMKGEYFENFKPVAHKNLTLFKQFLIGNSGKKSSNAAYTFKSLIINY